ncbi:hypothetical protein GCM10025881_04010 [Pseudolysinimonas kribbensis]|uniref:Uncharacterized protein n=1 Tax=Pseudolysinimonas kribbensis TaxID=433641 RepID=A0ABQ6K0V3_9MICO|nr:hypothetical protein [Pseudolysinimonas kribbensis]GMA93577.1 hypothetical protein GCM10025881_04010 [Pseudolysinimonas kribbensis]
MTRWQRTTPDAGDPAGIRRVAARRESWADELGEHSLTRLRDVIGDASDSRWTGAAATAFSEQAGQLPGLVSGLIERARDEADALRRYAAAIDRIADEAAALRTQLAGLRSAISRDASRLRTLRAADDPAEADRIRAVQLTSDLAGSRHSLASLDARWDELADERRRADATCAAALRPRRRRRSGP